MLWSNVTVSEQERGSVAVDGHSWLLWELDSRPSGCRMVSAASGRSWFSQNNKQKEIAFVLDMIETGQTILVGMSEAEETSKNNLLELQYALLL